MDHQRVVIRVLREHKKVSRGVQRRRLPDVIRQHEIQRVLPLHRKLLDAKLPCKPQHRLHQLNRHIVLPLTKNEDHLDFQTLQKAEVHVVTADILVVHKDVVGVCHVMGVPMRRFAAQQRRNGNKARAETLPVDAQPLRNPARTYERFLHPGSLIRPAAITAIGMRLRTF